jgi:hypothetical protein
MNDWFGTAARANYRLDSVSPETVVTVEEVQDRLAMKSK